MTQFLYDGDRLVAEYDGTSGALLRRYVHGVGTDEPLVWYEGPNGTPDKRWLLADHQGSIIGWTKPDGSLGEAYTYGPYGEPQTWGGSRFRYTGQIALQEAQVYDYKARVYDPGMGRFLQTDPIGQEDDPNLYVYVKDDPVDRTDPTGLAALIEIFKYPVFKDSGKTDFKHQFVKITDTKTGASWIARGGPKPGFPSVKLKGEVTSAAASKDSASARASKSIEKVQSTVLPKLTGQQAANIANQVVQNINRNEVPYNDAQNSNSLAADVGERLTGERSVSRDLPGSQNRVADPEVVERPK